MLNALLAKYGGKGDLALVSLDSPGCKACCVVEIKPERMTGKSDLAQSQPQAGYRRFIAQCLARRGRPEDLETIKAMGYTPDDILA